MPNTRAESPFEVLGVTPEVTDADLKRAYFRKVRQHPPEVDPEGYHQVHQAFEALRDASARALAAEVARAKALDPRVLDLLERSDLLARSDQRLAAVALLREAVALAPTLSLARERLIMVLISLEAKQEAVTHIETLIASRPDSAELQLLVAQLHISMYEYDIARAALGKARGFKPADRRAHFLEVRMLMQMERWNDALALLDEAMTLSDEHVGDIDVFSNRFLVHLERGDLEQVVKEAGSLEAFVASHPDLRQQAIDALNAVAARCLSARRRPVAEEMLTRVRNLGAGKTVPLGDLLRFRRSALEAPARVFLDDLATGVGGSAPFFFLKRPTSTLATTLVVIGMLAAGLSAALSMTFFAVMGGLVAAAGGVLLATRKKPQAPSLVCVRPFHLLVVEDQDVTAIPLLSIAGVSGSTSRIRVEVMGDPKPLILMPDEAPLRVMQILAEQTRRVSELMLAGMIDHELEVERFEWAPAPLPLAGSEPPKLKPE